MAGIYRDGKSWYLSWVQDGHQRRKSLGPITEAEAEAHRRAKEQSLAGIAAAGPLFCDWAVTYGCWHQIEYPESYARVEGILRVHLIPAFGSLPLMAITRDLVESYKQRRGDQATAGTVVKEIRTLQALLNRAVLLEVIPRNPVAAVRAPRDLASRPPRWFSREELAAIYAVELEIPACTTAADAEHHRQFRWTWQLLANTGIRRAEALHLRWSDIGAEQIAIRSEPDARTKSGHWRAVPISSGAREALTALRRGTLSVIPDLAPRSISRAFERTLLRANIDGRLHDLRHTYISHLVMAGIPLRTVQVLAGHASHSTTERYAHLAPSALRDAVAALHL